MNVDQHEPELTHILSGHPAVAIGKLPEIDRHLPKVARRIAIVVYIALHVYSPHTA